MYEGAISFGGREGIVLTHGLILQNKQTDKQTNKPKVIPRNLGYLGIMVRNRAKSLTDSPLFKFRIN